MKNSRLFLLFCVCLSLFSFDTINNSTAAQKSTYHDRIKGHWYISEVYVNDEKINIDKVPYCENKENITFKESTLVWEEYSYYSKRCFKSATTGNYIAEPFYTSYGTSKIKDAVGALKISIHGRLIRNYAIMNIDNTSLKLKNEDGVMKHFKKVKDSPDNRP